jgi:hypothetical protein
MTITFKPDALGRPSMPKRVDATLKYTFNFTNWLGTDNIASASVTVDDESGLSLVGLPAVGAKAVTVEVTGGIAHKKGRLTCRIATANNDADSRSLWLDLVPY